MISRPSTYARAVDDTMAAQGDVLAGRYRLIEPLGQGGMGTVWRAEHVELGSEVAVKLLAESVANSETNLTRFKREAKAAASLTSAHVVQIFDYGVDDAKPYIAMELLHGENLAERLVRLRKLPPAQIAHILRHVARALDKAHEAGITHRDMKPDNVFITAGEGDEAEDEVVKVLDFGVAKALNPDILGTVSSSTSTGALLGSPYYMGPQQIRGQKDLDHRADLWSIGVFTYQCVTGKRPFDGDALGDLVMAVCSDPIPVPSEHGAKLAGFDEWFAKACARKPEERFQSASEMSKAFRALLAPGVADEQTHDSIAESSVHTPSVEAVRSARSEAQLREAPVGPETTRAATTSHTKLVVIVALALVVAALTLWILLGG